MSGFSKKQQIFAEYLLHQFGIDDAKFISTFLKYYTFAYGQYIKYPSGKSYFNISDCITQLVLEKDIRKNRYNIKNKSRQQKHINASDLANFTFCPASYSIANSFIIEYPTGEKQRLIGEQLHAKLNLIRSAENYQKSKEMEHSVFSDPDILIILNSKAVYSGHGDRADNKVFVNSENNIACDPDYIFLDNENRYFLVEEKYHYTKDPSKVTYEEQWSEWNGYNTPEDDSEIEKRVGEWKNSKIVFFRNHQIQVITYLKNIKEFNLEFGFLIYWFYDFNGEEPYIHKVGIKKIILNSYTEDFYNATLNDFNSLTDEKEQAFNIEKINATKCAGCVVNKYCGHKSGKYSEVSLPYKLDYLKFYKTEFPEALKKNTG